MRNFAAKNWKRSIYWIILFSLMTGLLFSNSEGIRLLPFPVSEKGDARNFQSLGGKNSSVYNPSAQNSATTLLKKLNTKFQKNLKHLNAAAAKVDRTNVALTCKPESEKDFQALVRSYRSVHLISFSDRAPPVI